MKIYIRRSNSITWREITENVNLPITINDTVDGGYLTANLSCRFKKVLIILMLLNQLLLSGN